MKIGMSFATPLTPWPSNINGNGFNLNNAGSVQVGNFVNFGDPNVNGSWRMSISGTDIIVERRESGSWVNKGGFTA